MSTAVVIDAADIAEPVPVAPKARSRRGLLIAAGAAVLAIAGVGGGAYVFLGNGSHGEATAAAAHASTEAYVDVPQMTVNLRSTDGRARFVKLHFMLVANDAGQVEAIKAKLPLYLDALQPFLRELRPEDLNGSAAVFRMKEEMLTRANDALGAGTVRDVLIQDLIQQ